jgi:hypothetical protein
LVSTVNQTTAILQRFALRLLCTIVALPDGDFTLEVLRDHLMAAKREAAPEG